VSSGTFTADHTVVLRTAIDSLTVIDSTTVLWSGSASCSVGAGEQFCDAISLGLDAAHDYYIAIHGTSGAPYKIATIPTALGDQTGVTTIPSISNELMLDSAEPRSTDSNCNHRSNYHYSCTYDKADLCAFGQASPSYVLHVSVEDRCRLSGVLVAHVEGCIYPFTSALFRSLTLTRDFSPMPRFCTSALTLATWDASFVCVAWVTAMLLNTSTATKARAESFIDTTPPLN